MPRNNGESVQPQKPSPPKPSRLSRRSSSSDGRRLRSSSRGPQEEWSSVDDVIADLYLKRGPFDERVKRMFVDSVAKKINGDPSTIDARRKLAEATKRLAVLETQQPSATKAEKTKARTEEKKAQEYVRLAFVAAIRAKAEDFVSNPSRTPSSVKAGPKKRKLDSAPHTSDTENPEDEPMEDDVLSSGASTPTAPSGDPDEDDLVASVADELVAKEFARIPCEPTRDASSQAYAAIQARMASFKKKVDTARVEIESVKQNVAVIQETVEGVLDHQESQDARLERQDLRIDRLSALVSESCTEGMSKNDIITLVNLVVDSKLKNLSAVSGPSPALVPHPPPQTSPIETAYAFDEREFLLKYDK